MRNGIKCLSAAAILAGIAGSASAQLTVDQALGTLAVGSSTQITGTFDGLEGGDADAYSVASIANQIRTFVADEVAVSFTLTEGAQVEIAPNSAFTGVGDFLVMLADSTEIMDLVLDVGTFPTLLSTLDFVVIDGTTASAFPAEVPAGNYFLCFDPFTGASPIIPADSAGSFDVQLNINEFVAGVCGSETGLMVDFPLGALADGDTNLAGDTTGQPNEICGYRNSEGLFVFPFLTEFGEDVYEFSTGAEKIFNLTNNEGIFVGVDHDHHLLDGLAFTTGFDLFGDGSTFGVVADNALATVDEEGTWGARPAGTYYISIDGFDGDGLYDVTLNIGDPVNCGTGDGPSADQGDAGTVTDGGAVSFIGIDTSGPGFDNDICGYRDSDGFFTGFLAEFNETGVQFTTDAAATGGTGMNISIVNIEGAGVGVDHDHYLTDGLAFTAGFDLFGDGTVFGDVSDNAVGFVDEEGSFGIYPDGTYFLFADGFDGDGIVDIDITFASVNLPPETIDPDTESIADLGIIGDSANPVTISMCGLTDDTVDTFMGLWDRDTGVLIATNDDGCAFFGPSTFDNIVLAGGAMPGDTVDYVLSIGSFPTDFVNPFSDGLNHNVAAMDPVAGSIDFNGVSTQAFSTNAFERAVFTFSIEFAEVMPPPATDLGTIAVDENNIISIDTCGAGEFGFDTELGLWDAAGNLLASNDDSAVICTLSDPARQSTIQIDFSDVEGNFDPAAEGLKFFFSVSGFNTVFTGGFQATPTATAAFNMYSGNVNDVMYSGETTDSLDVDFYCFTVTGGDTGLCSPADVFPVGMGDGILDINDVLQFGADFNTMNPAADFFPVGAPDGNFDINDVLQFGADFNDGGTCN